MSIQRMLDVSVITNDGVVCDVTGEAVSQSPVLAELLDMWDPGSPPVPIPLSAAAWKAVWSPPPPNDPAFVSTLNAANFLAADRVIEGMLESVVRPIRMSTTAEQAGDIASFTRGALCNAMERYHATAETCYPRRDPRLRELHRWIVRAKDSDEPQTSNCMMNISWDDQSDMEAIAELELVLHNPGKLPLFECFDGVELMASGDTLDHVPTWVLPSVAALNGRAAPTTDGDMLVVPLPFLSTHRDELMPLVKCADLSVRVHGLAFGVRVLGIRGTRIAIDRATPVPAGAWYEKRGRPNFERSSRGVQAQDVRIDSPEQPILIGLNFNHPMHVLLVGGLDPGRVKSAHLRFNYGLTVDLLPNHDIATEQELQEKLDGVDGAVVDRAMGMLRAWRETIGDVMVFRLSAAPLDVNNPGRLINASRVHSIVLDIATDEHPTDVRVALIYWNCIHNASLMFER